MRFHLIRHDAFAVTTKFPVPAFAVKLIESHSQSLPTLPVAMLPEDDTIIFDVPDILPFVIVNRLLLTGIHEPKSISVSVSEKLHPAAFSVVQVKERLVPSVISSITPVPAVPRPMSLLVVIDVVSVLFADRSPPPDSGAVVDIVVVVGTFVESATVIFAVPSKDTPFIVRAVVSFGADTTVRAGVVVGLVIVRSPEVDETFVTVHDPPPHHPICNVCLLFQFAIVISI